jgi:ATP-dependent DNA helicase RecG
MIPSDLVSAHHRLLPAQKKALEKLGIRTLADLLLHLPSRYVSSGGVRQIDHLAEGENASIFAEVTKAETRKTFRGGMPTGELTVRDTSGTLKAMWFRQPYIAKMHPVGTYVKLDGVVKKRGNTVTMLNPHIEKMNALPGTMDGTLFEGDGKQEEFYPVYPETRGITSKWFFHAIDRALGGKVHEQMEDMIPEETLKRYNLPSLASAIVWIHRPQKPAHSESARKRFAFQEIFLIQLMRQRARALYQAHEAYTISRAHDEAVTFTKRLPFPLTPAQADAVASIAKDLSGSRPMLRLLEGDVGSGKTAVVAAVAAAIISSRPKGQPLQVAYMCPTEILAEQQFRSFIQYFKHTGIQVGLLTGSGAVKFPSKVSPDGTTSISRAQLLKWVASGEMPILVGTHALIQKRVKWKSLALAVIDEQHRFGTAQRGALAGKSGIAPHVLSMTATPIPRTLALTLYGDLDLSVIDTMPPGRKPIITEIVTTNKRASTEEKIRVALKEGRQAYVICPRIDEPDPEKEMAIQAKSVRTEAKRLKESVFRDARIEVMHSKMKPLEKQRIMEEFSRGDIDILVSTSVVEVGVNVPNATIIVIEGAERFGLAQLHQLRGRVLRGTHQAYCYLYADAKSEKTVERLKAITQAKNGFELAERDLALRGSGELSGGKQWGISDIGMEAIRNLKMVEAARTESEEILKRDPDLAHHPLLRAFLEKAENTVHLE